MFSRILLSALGLAALMALGAVRPAQALPVFSSTRLSEDAISPNGDGVKDLTIISYTVDVDTALVRIILTGGGGSIQDTLQIFSRRGRGVHSLPFDGTTSKGTVPDGTYQIQILGVGALGEGTEPATLSLLIDRVPPPITSWDVVSPGTTLQNGDPLTLQVCYDETPDSVSLDLSGLDSAFDPALVTTTPVGATCLHFDYTISPTNTFPDSSPIPARVTLVDRAGNESEAVLDLCLSNFPLSLLEVTLRNQADIFRNGDEIRVHAAFSSGNDITPGADFSSIDSQFDPSGVVVEEVAPQAYDLSYVIRSGNTRPDGPHRLIVFARDAGCGYAADSSLVVTLDNAGQESTLITNARMSRNAFCPTGLPGESVGFPTVDIRFDVIEDTVIVGITAVADLRSDGPNPAAKDQRITILRTQPDGVLPRGSYSFTWDGSGISSNHTPQRLVEQDVTIEIHVTSIALDRTLTQDLHVAVDRTPPVLLSFPPTEELAAKNGVRLDIPVTYDGDGYKLSADFSGLDSHFDPGLVSPTQLGNGDYEIFYRVTTNNARPDSTNITIPITAVDVAGNAGVSNVVQACLNNLPPRFVSARFLDHSGPFRSGQRISLQTAWSTEAAQGGLQVTADFSAVDDQFDPGRVTVVDRGSNVFDIGYTLTTTSSIKTGTDLPIRVTASDDPSRGCGSTLVDAVLVTLDNEAPPRPTLIASAQVVTEPFVIVSGQAPEAVKVRIEREGASVDTFDVDPLSFAYSGQVHLQPGINSLTARSLDVAGNQSVVSGAPLDILLVQGNTFEVPSRFIPGGEFLLASSVPASGVRVRIFNLDGVEIQRLEEGPGDLYQISWDGTDTYGNMTSSGPYIAVAEIDVNGSLRDRIRKAFVFTRAGSAP